MKKKKGQAIVEVALVLPIIAFLLCGITDFGRILFAANNINMVSQEAARYASLSNKTNDQVRTFAINKCSLSDKETKLGVDTTYSEPGEYGVYVEVEVSYTVNYITPLMQSIIENPYIVRASSTVRVE